MVTAVAEMEKITIGSLLKRLREQKGVTQGQLSRDSGIDRAYISQIESGKTVSIRVDTAKALAKGLGVSPEVFFTDANIDDKILPKPFSSLIRDLQEKYEALELIEIPLLGSVPCGTPFPAEQQTEGHVYIARDELAGIINPSKLYALRVTGNSLSNDGIYEGDNIIVDPTQKELVDGKIFVVRLENEVCARHICIKQGLICLVSSNSDYKVLTPDQIEILGSVVLSGRWKKH